MQYIDLWLLLLATQVLPHDELMETKKSHRQSHRKKVLPEIYLTRLLSTKVTRHKRLFMLPAAQTDSSYRQISMSSFHFMFFSPILASGADEKFHHMT